MIKISKLADYGLVLLRYLATAPKNYYSASVLAERTGITLPTVSKILKLLHEAGLVTSIRGANGGYQLAKAPEQLNVMEVIAAVDGTPALTECCQTNGHCVHDDHCQLRSGWRRTNKTIMQTLSQLTLTDL